MINEQSSFFGENAGLLGTLCLPASAGAARVGLLLLNSGFIGRGGPNRLNVKLARRQALRGVPSLRFDLSGLGDSRQASGVRSFAEQSVIDLRSAADFLAGKARVEQLVIVGLCSGADNGYAAALADPRVVGLVMIDPWIYPGPMFGLRRAYSRLLEYGAMGAARRIRDIGRQRAQQRGLAQGAVGELSLWQRVFAVAAREAPPRAVFLDGLSGLCRRGVSIWMLYTNGSQQRADYHAEIKAWGPQLSAAVEHDFLGGVDHTISEIAAQREFLDRFDAWFDSVVQRRANVGHATEGVKPGLNLTPAQVPTT